MSDPTKPNLSETMSGKLADLGVPSHRIPGKVRSALLFGIPAVICGLACVALVAWVVIGQIKGNPPGVVLIAICMAVFALPGMYFWKKADTEGVDAMLETWLRAGKGARGIVKGEGANG
jgi:hypothetical protein